MKGIILAGGERYASLPYYKRGQQTADTDLRQTDDLLSAFGIDAFGHYGSAHYLHTAGPSSF